MPFAKNSGADCSTEELEPCTPVHPVVATLVADGLERSTYLGVVRALLGVGAAVAGQARVDAFGLAVSASLR